MDEFGKTLDLGNVQLPAYVSLPDLGVTAPSISDWGSPVAMGRSRPLSASREAERGVLGNIWNFGKTVVEDLISDTLSLGGTMAVAGQRSARANKPSSPFTDAILGRTNPISQGGVKTNDFYKYLADVPDLGTEQRDFRALGLNLNINPAESTSGAAGQVAKTAANFVPVGWLGAVGTKALRPLVRGGAELAMETAARGADDVVEQGFKALQDVGGKPYQTTLDDMVNLAGEKGSDIIKKSFKQRALESAAIGGGVTSLYTTGAAMEAEQEFSEILKAGAIGAGIGTLFGLGITAGGAALSKFGSKASDKIISKYNSLVDPQAIALDEVTSKAVLATAKKKGSKIRYIDKLKKANKEVKYIPDSEAIGQQGAKLTSLQQELMAVQDELANLLSREDVKLGLETGKKVDAVEVLEARKARIENQIDNTLDRKARGLNDPELNKLKEKQLTTKKKAESFLTAASKKTGLSVNALKKKLKDVDVDPGLKVIKTQYNKLLKQQEAIDLNIAAAKEYRKTPEGKKAFSLLTKKQSLEMQLKATLEDLDIRTAKNLESKQAKINREILKTEESLKKLQTPPKEIRQVLKQEAKLKAIEEAEDQLYKDIATKLKMSPEEVKESLEYTFDYYKKSKQARTTMTKPGASVILPKTFTKAAEGFNDIDFIDASNFGMGTIVTIARKIDGGSNGIFMRTVVRPVLKAIGDKYEWQNTMKKRVADEVGQPSLGVNSRFASNSQKFGLPNAKADLGKNSYFSEIVQKRGEKVLTDKSPEWKALSKEDQAFVDNAVKVYTKNFDEMLISINKARAAAGLPPIPRIENYFRRVRETNIIRNIFEGDFDLSTTSKGDERVAKFMRSGMRSTTSAGGADKKRTQEIASNFDAALGMDNYIDIASGLIHLQQPIDTLRAAAIYLKPNAETWINKFTNAMTGEAALLDKAVDSIGAKPLLKVLNYGQNVIGTGMSISTGLMGLSMYAINAAAIGARWSTKAFSAPKEIIEMQAKSSYLKGRILRPTDKLGRTKFEHFNYYGNVFNSFTDGLTVTNAWRAAALKIRAAGVTNEDAIVTYADDMARKLHGETSPLLLPLPLRSQTFKMIAPFQTFVVNFYNLATKELPGIIKEEGLAEFMGVATRMMAAMHGTNMAYDAANLPRPFTVGSFVPMYGTIQPVIQSVFDESDEEVRFQGIRPGNVFVKFAADFTKGLVNGDEASMLKSMASLTPSQFRDIAGTLEAYLDGGSFSGIGTDDPKFQMQNELLEYLKGMFVGPYNTPGGADYVEQFEDRDIFMRLQKGAEDYTKQFLIPSPDGSVQDLLNEASGVETFEDTLEELEPINP